MTGSTSGDYKCLASNILGQSEALVQLVVNGKFIHVAVFLVPFNYGPTDLTTTTRLSTSTTF